MNVILLFQLISRSGACTELSSASSSNWYFSFVQLPVQRSDDVQTGGTVGRKLENTLLSQISRYVAGLRSFT